MSERRMDRLVNPLVSGLPPFLASDAGSNSGFMIAQYTAAALSNENCGSPHLLPPMAASRPVFRRIFWRTRRLRPTSFWR